MTKEQIKSATKAVERNTAKRAQTKAATITPRRVRKTATLASHRASTTPVESVWSAQEAQERREAINRKNAIKYGLAHICVAALGATSFWLCVMVIWLAVG